MKKQKGKSISFKFDSYTGNFEREFIAYVTGILTSVQLNIDFEEACYDLWTGKIGDRSWSKFFWKEEFNLEKRAIDFYIKGVDNCSWDHEKIDFVKYLDQEKFPEGYHLHKYLRHVLEDVDDWSEWTFYNVDWSMKNPTNGTDLITIYLTDDVDEATLELLKRRAKEFTSVYKLRDWGSPNASEFLPITLLDII